ncbi:MAG: aldehyde dehydrogenase family protein [Caldilineaceae bacterium]
MQQNGQLSTLSAASGPSPAPRPLWTLPTPPPRSADPRPPLPGAEVAAAVAAGQQAFADWKEMPVGDRIQPMFKFKMLLEENLDDIARTITNECGKTYGECGRNAPRH